MLWNGINPVKKIGNKTTITRNPDSSGLQPSSLEGNRMFRVWLKSINTEWNAESENNSL